MTIESMRPAALVAVGAADHDVVRPLETGGGDARAPHRVADGDADREGQAGHVARREHEPEHRRQIDAGAGCRVPGPALAATAGALRGGGDHRAVLAAGAGEARRLVAGRAT
jgi:hypothetical protein